MEKIKEFCKNHIVDLVCITTFVFFVFSIWLLYTASRTTNDYNHVHNTVQSVERDNQQTRQQIGNASAKIDSAEKQLNDSIKRTGEIAERTQQTKKRIDGNAEIIAECQNLIESGRRDTEEARSIFADIDQANQITGAQADSHA